MARKLHAGLWKGCSLRCTGRWWGRGVGRPWGEILSAGKDLEVACAEGSLRLLEVQPEGKRRMSASDFLLGRKVRVGAHPMKSRALAIEILAR